MLQLNNQSLKLQLKVLLPVKVRPEVAEVALAAEAAEVEEVAEVAPEVVPAAEVADQTTRNGSHSPSSEDSSSTE